MVRRMAMVVSGSKAVGFVLCTLLVVVLAGSLAARYLSAKADAVWQMETVDSAGAVGLYPSLVLDADGNPHISYSDDTYKDLKYARWDGTEWQVETVESDGDVGSYSSLALDNAGNPHISYLYTSGGQYQLKYTYWDGAWQPRS
jgi:hypothetical protein